MSEPVENTDRPVADSVLAGWVADRRAEAPARSGPLPRPMRSSEPVDVAQELAAARETERY